MRLFLPEGRSEIDRETLVCGGAEVFEKDPVPQEIGTEHFWGVPGRNACEEPERGRPLR
jgi:hypothetical protein